MAGTQQQPGAPAASAGAAGHHAMGRGSESLNAAAPRPVRWLLDVIDRLGRLDGWLGAICLMALTGLILAEVALRSLSNVLTWLPGSIPVAWEYASYMMAASFTFGAAMTLRGGGHIRVTLLLANVPAPLRRLLEVWSALIALAFVGFLAWAMGRFTWNSYVFGQTSLSSATRLWIPQAVVTFGICLLAVQLLARLIQALFGLPLEDPRMRAGAAVE